MNLFTSRNFEDTIRIGERIGHALDPGMVLDLRGKLGVGKTTLVKGIARGLAIEEEITSPSFTLISEYQAPSGVPFLHIDLYRIEEPQELEDLGLEGILYGQEAADRRVIAVIEWGDRAAALLPDDSIRIVVELEGDGSRRIRLRGLEL